ncbi:hypothetical protein BpHYR1_002128 [Brachionus plicatilis]|uniref:Uncharacterized protein n=1 Tax=Brachionus plicatilis TaxID=10195 RepID=A0A3M7RWU7_BRAPC|nr:hypothetical protein BpHYR1_002128 [Brachionus plicatilis]
MGTLPKRWPIACNFNDVYFIGAYYTPKANRTLLSIQFKTYFYIYLHRLFLSSNRIKRKICRGKEELMKGKVKEKKS